MTKEADADFEALATRLTDPDTPLPAPRNVATGQAAADQGRNLMMSEYGSTAALDTVLRSAGQPRLGATAKGPSPEVRGRLAAAERVRFNQLSEQSGKGQSELVREVVQLLLDHYKVASRQP